MTTAETLKAALTAIDTSANAMRQFRSILDGADYSQHDAENDGLREGAEVYSDEATKLLARMNRMQERVRITALSVK